MVQTTKKTDTEIQESVLDELRWDTRIKEAAVSVEVDRGIVTLTGSVDTWTARLAAQEAAHRVAGVMDVANDIQVEVSGSLERTDADIARAVRGALEWDVLVPQARITTTVSNGVVTLSGRVDYWSQYEDAARAVRNLAGVVEVKNEIDVEPPAVAPHAVRSAIDRALARHAAHCAKHVNIAIADDRVVLTGEVPSWAERATVEGAVRGTPGVRRVDNHLHIRV